MTTGPITLHANGSRTQFPPPPPHDSQSLSRTRSSTTLPPHLHKTMEAARMNLTRSLVLCRSVPLEPRTEGRTSQRALSDPPGARGETLTGARASRTSTTETTATKRLEKPLRTTPCLRSRNYGAKRQDTREAPRESPHHTATQRTGSLGSERGEEPALPP